MFLNDTVSQRNVLRYKKYAKAYKWSLVQHPADVYVVCLLFILLFYINNLLIGGCVVVTVRCGRDAVHRGVDER